MFAMTIHDGESNESSVFGMVTKVEENMEEEKEDRVSELPDCLLLEILSRLPSTKTAITTATLSKRWTNLWTSVPTLAFIQTYDHLSPSDFVSYVDQTLTQCRQLKLRKFEVFTGYDILFEAKVDNWIRYAISCNVEELKLSFYHYHSGGQILLNGYFFVNSSFTDLTLHRCIFNPTGMISWKRLRTLWISWGNLDEYLIENILSGSPVLETLVLESCRGYRRLNITSKSVKKLVVCGYCPDDVSDDLADIVEINAPHILSLKILGKLLLWKLVLFNVSSLLEAFLNYTKFGYNEHTFKEAEEEMLKGFMQSFCHVNVLKIGRICAKVIDRLEAKGFSIPSNVKLLDVTSLV